MAQNPDAVEKKGGTVVEEENLSVSSAEQVQDLDNAGKFLQDHKDMDTSHIDIAKLRHKIDRNVITCLCLVFIMTFLDRAIYNVRLLELHIGLRLHKLVCWNYGCKKGPETEGFRVLASTNRYGADMISSTNNLMNVPGYAVAHLLMQVPNVSPFSRYQ